MSVRTILNMLSLALQACVTLLNAPANMEGDSDIEVQRINNFQVKCNYRDKINIARTHNLFDPRVCVE